jgi:ABC-type spermidine/putrescine transport system permease subunit II
MVRSLIFFVAAAPLLAVVLLGEPALHALLHEPSWLAAALRSLLIAEVSVPLALLLAVPAAAGAYRAAPASRRWLTGLCVLPVLVPPAWLAAGLRDGAARAGFHGAHVAALIAAHAAPAASVAFLIVLWSIDRCAWPVRDVALAQGAGTLRALWLAGGRCLPEGMALSAAAAFAVSAGLTIPDVVLAPAFHPTLGTLLMVAQRTDDAHLAAAALLLAIFCLAPAGLVFGARLLRRRG